MRLQYIQEQSRQTILPGLELFYEHPPFKRPFSLSNSIQPFSVFYGNTVNFFYTHAADFS